MITLHLPQVILMLVMVLNVVMAAAKDGQPFPEKHQRYSFNRAMFSFLVVTGLLWWGGFFGVQA